LLGTGRRDEAKRTIGLLNGVDPDHPLVHEVIEELDFGIKAENEGGKATWMECFSTRNNLWKRTGNGMMLQFIQQLNGQNFYCKSTDTYRDLDSLTYWFALAPADYYGDTFFKSAGTE
jgi:SP family sugar:H+ symporter-like MFS transporter